jgi:superfamily II DNA/RNA helicase
MAAGVFRQALTDSEKYEMQRSYGVEHVEAYDFKIRQEAFYVELLCSMYDCMRAREVEPNKRESYENELLRIAKGLLVFSDPSTENEFSHINKKNNTLFVATIYYICGYSAIASLLLKKMDDVYFETYAAQQLYALIQGKEYPDGEEKLGESVVLGSLLTGNNLAIKELERVLIEKRSRFDYTTERDFFDEQMLHFALNRFMGNNIAADLYTYDSNTDWMPYIKYSVSEGILSFLPSQRDAIEKGLLNFSGSFSLKMPTSAGKSYVTELLIYQELANKPDSKVLYLAPLRSLSRELGDKFKRIKKFFGYKVAVKYGGGAAVDNGLSDDIQILVSTPEFFISLEEGIEDLLEQYKLIICDEGQLLDDYSRGVNYEMLLTRLRKCNDKRFLFISAIIPNIQEINKWLGGTDKLIGGSTYRPSSIKLSKVVVNAKDLDLLVYGQDYDNILYKIEKFVDSHHLSFGTSRNMDLSCAAALQAVRAGSVMLYVSFKRGNRGCEAFSRTILGLLYGNDIRLPSRDDESLKNLLHYIDYQCGGNYLLTQCVAKGFAYHHADIPQDCRELIEEAIDSGIIELVVCTSTLAEGVNLPLKTIVLGNINDPMYANLGWYLDRASLKNILGRVGRAGRERYGLVIFPDNKRKNPFAYVQDSLKDNSIPEARGTLFRLVDYLVNTEKVKDLNDINELLGDNNLVSAIDLMIMKSTEAHSLDDLSIDDLIRDSLAYKLGDGQQRVMLKNVFQARYSRLKEQFDADEYAFLKSTGFTVRDLNKAHEILSHADAKVFAEVNYQGWRAFLCHLFDKLYLLPSIQEEMEIESHKYVGDYIRDIGLMKRICILWMEGVNYKDIAAKADTNALDVDKTIVSTIFLQNCICRQVKPLVNYMKEKYGVENDFLDDFHELMSVGIQEEEQLYLYHHGLRNRVCLHALMDYIRSVGVSITEYEHLSLFMKERLYEILEYLASKGYPHIVSEMIEKWVKTK